MVVNAAGWEQGTKAMTNSTKLVMALALILAAIMVAVGDVNDTSRADAAALPSVGPTFTPSNETPVRATKGDRLDSRPKIREIAGVTLVLRDFSRTVR